MRAGSTHVSEIEQITTSIDQALATITKAAERTRAAAQAGIIGGRLVRQQAVEHHQPARRQLDRHDIQSPVQILAEGAVDDRLLQVAVRRRHQPDIDPPRGVLAETAETDPATRARIRTQAQEIVREISGAIADDIDTLLEKQLGDKRLYTEGYQDSRWIVLDYGDLVIHLFDTEMRIFYRLEDVWGDAPRIEV
mgnify:CR=1 FL=1